MVIGIPDKKSYHKLPLFASISGQQDPLGMQTKLLEHNQVNIERCVQQAPVAVSCVRAGTRDGNLVQVNKIVFLCFKMIGTAMFRPVPVPEGVKFDPGTMRLLGNIFPARLKIYPVVLNNFWAFRSGCLNNLLKTVLYVMAGRVRGIGILIAK